MVKPAHILLAAIFYLLTLCPVTAQEATPSPTPVDPVQRLLSWPREIVSSEGTESTEQSGQSDTPTAYLLKSPLTSRVLFAVAGSGNISAQERANTISDRLKRIVDNSQSEELPVTLEQQSDERLIYVDGQLLASVLPEDVLAQPNVDEVTSAALQSLAQEWQQSLQSDLSEARFIASPAYYWTVGAFLLLGFAGACFIHAKARTRIARRTALPTWLLRSAVWISYAVVVLWSFPSLRKWSVALYKTAFQPLFLLIGVIVGTSLVIHLFETMVNSYFRSVIADDTPIFTRQYRRLSTLNQVSLVTGRILLVLLAVTLYFALLPINYGPLLAGASVLSVALGFAAQDVLRDLFSGVSILAEDRFGVGDWIEWNGQQGAVESFNLKSTKMRKVDGSVLIIGNADLRVVANLSNEWSQVDYRVDIAYEADFKKAGRCLLEEAQQLAHDWEARILGEPELKGVQSLGESGVTLRLFLRTVPLAQWDVERELNARVKTRFDSEGISIPYPQRRVWFTPLEAPGTPSTVAPNATLRSKINV